MNTMKRFFFCTLIAIFCSVPVLCMAQAGANDESALQGQWVYESVAAFEGTVPQAFSLENLDCCEIPISITINPDEITFAWKDRTETVPSGPILRGNTLCFPICGQWKIADNKLQLQWTQDIMEEIPRMFTIILTYKSN